MKAKIKAKISSFSLIIIQTAVIVCITLFAVLPISCKVTTEGIEIIGGDYKAPVIEAVNVVNERTVTMSFSEAVNLKRVVMTPFIPGVSDSSQHSTTIDLSPSLAAASGLYGSFETTVVKSEDGKLITFLFDKDTDIGKTYEVFGTVEDSIGNTLTFCIPFVGYNSSVPKIIMTEVQIKYQKGTSKGETIYRGEYVELLALEDGNLAGLELVSAADGEEKKYVFPAIEVMRGEVFLVHLRSIGEGCINEDGDEYNLATAPHSNDKVRDLWSDQTVAHFNDTADIIFLRNSIDGSIVDGVMYASPDSTDWKSSIADYALDVADAGIYVSQDIENASSSKGATTLKSLTRVDSLAILNLAMEDEEYEYPVPSDEASWCVMPVSPGTL